MLWAYDAVPPLKHCGPVMSATSKPLSVEEFLAWERAQQLRYEFDGIQPVAMTGGSRAHSRIQTRIVIALGSQVRPPCEVHGSELKVLTPGASAIPMQAGSAADRMTTAILSSRPLCSNYCPPRAP